MGDWPGLGFELGSIVRRELEERSCCKPALTAAAACKDVEAERLGDGEPLWP